MNAESYTSGTLLWWKRARQLFRQAWEETSFIAAGILAIAICVLGLIVFVGVYINPHSSEGNFIYYFLGTEDKEEAMLRLAWIMVFTASAGGLWTANRRAKAMEHTAQNQARAAKVQAQAAKAQAQAAEAQAQAVKTQAQAAKAVESGNVQQRFKDAIEHLESKSESVRIGGAHALFHMALEVESLRASIADILCTHIRIKTQSREYQESHLEGPSVEIQSLMDLLFAEITHGSAYNREEQIRKFWRGLQANLSDGYFSGIKLRRAQFRYAHLHNAQFLGASLLHAQFQASNLSDAQFHMAHLPSTCFQGARLTDTKFWNASLKEAQFQSAHLNGTHFQGVNLESVQFQGGFCDKPKLTMRDFEKQIKDRIGENADLSEVIFSGGVDLENLEEVVGKLTHLKYFKNRGAAKMKKFEEKMSQHDGPAEHTVPKEIPRAHVGAYTKEEAQEWIAEYEKLGASG